MKKLGEKVGMTIKNERVFGVDHADTLAEWRDRFRLQPQAGIGAARLRRAFRRMWEYYLAYCEAGFREGDIDVRQIVYAKA